MAINEDGVYIPDDYETIRNLIETNQYVMGTKFHIFKDTVYQATCNPLVTAIYNLQLELAELPMLVSNEISMQGVYIKRSDAITSDAITSKAKESEFIDYAKIFNTSGDGGIKTARIELYIYKDEIDFTSIDLQYTANEIALITPVFVPYFLDESVTTALTYSSTVSAGSVIDVIFNVAETVLTSVNITTNPIIGDESLQLKADFTELFNATQTIGVSFDEVFYQRNLFIDGLSSMGYTATAIDCSNNQILRLEAVTVNGV